MERGMAKFIDAKRNGVLLRVHLQPKAKKNEIAGIHGEALKVRVHAPPVNGKANEEARLFLAKTFGIKRQHVILTAGNASRQKTFLLKNVDENAILTKLDDLVHSLR